MHSWYCISRRLFLSSGSPIFVFLMRKKSPSYPKWLPYLILVALLGIFIWLRFQKAAPRSKDTEKQVKPAPQPKPAATTDYGFNRNPVQLRISRHARCRMKCRHIDESEIREMIAAGQINIAKSELDNPARPRYAMEGITHDGQRVRIVLAQEGNTTTVITVIDLGKEWKCAC